MGGVPVGDGPDHPPALDVAIDERHRRQGHATALYDALSSAGIDVEAASAASRAHRAMTVEGNLSMVGRRRKREAEAAGSIADSAKTCPSCGRSD